MTDSQLLAEFVDSQSHEAFEGIVQRYIILVHGTARRMIPDEHLAQDVVQATFIVLLKKAPKVNPRTLPGWLVNTTRLVAREAMRAERTREKRETQIAEMRSPIAPTDNEPGIEQMMPMLDDALARLSSEDRAAVVMRFLEGASFAQVAAAMDSTEDAARKRVARALNKLRKIFTRQGLVLSSAGLMGVLATQQAHAVPAAVVTATTTSVFTGGTAASSHLAHVVLSAMGLAKATTVAVAATIALLIVSGSAVLLIRPHHKTPPPVIIAVTPAHPVQIAPPPITHASIWLKTFKVGPSKRLPLLVRELYRQALLIAARDGMGLQTRDESLREWRDAPPPEQTLNLVIDNGVAEVTTGDDATDIFDQQDLPPGEDREDLDIVAREAEVLSRDNYITMLKAHHWSGNGNTIKEDGAAPADAEARLAELDELSQFAILRETHELIRTDGETPQRLAVLIRAYANLGQITWDHWSIDNRVYIARSLLYAQRLVVRYPDSPQSYWLRAYAKAVAGLPQPALDDLDAADKLQSNTPPPYWVELIRLSTQNQNEKLLTLAADNLSQAPLATFLACLNSWEISDQPTVQRTLAAAVKANPNCMRVLDVSSINNEFQVYSDLLGAKLDGMPKLPASIVEQIQKLSVPGGNPSGRETICQALIAQGNPSLDHGEPSWTALGRMIQETTFDLIVRRADLLRSSDYTAQVLPLVADHPFEPLIEVFGLTNTGTNEDLEKILKRIPMGDITWAEYPLTNVLDGVPPRDKTQLSSGTITDESFGSLLDGLSPTNFDLDMFFNSVIEDLQTKSPLGKVELRNLRRINPHSAHAAIVDIKGYWNPQMGAQYEIEYANDHNVMYVLAHKYSRLKWWADAERCYKKCIALKPTEFQYPWDLGRVYRIQGKFDQYVSTMKQMLAGNFSPNRRAKVNEDLAEFYMTRHQYQVALAYADEAASYPAEWTEQCEALAHTEAGDFDVAEKLMINSYQTYNRTPLQWYAWCLHTGHGHVAAAKKALDDYFAGHPRDKLSAENLFELALLAIQEKRYADAFPLFKQIREVYGYLTLALWCEADCAAAMHDTAREDYLFNQIHLFNDYGWDEEMRPTMVMLEEAYHTHQLDTQAIDDAIAWTALPEARIEICYFTAHCLQTLGRQAEATQYLRRCNTDNVFYTVEWIVIDQELRDQGIDPFLITEPDIHPSTEPSTQLHP